MATTHDWAKDLIRTANFMLSKEAIEIGDIPVTRASFYYTKDTFLAMVRAMKPGKKTMDTYYVNFLPRGANLELYINRDLICKRLNPVYECEPLLSAAEDAEMEAAAVGTEIERESGEER